MSEWYHTILSLSGGICISLLLLGALVDSHFMDFRRFPKPQEKVFPSYSPVSNVCQKLQVFDLKL